MLSIEPIQISKNELKRLVLAAVLMPPACTLAGVLAVASWIPAESVPEAPSVHANANGGGIILRAPDSIPTLELADSAIELSAPISLMPAALPVEIPIATPVEVALTTEPDNAVSTETGPASLVEPTGQTTAAETVIEAAAGNQAAASEEAAVTNEAAAAIAAAAEPAALVQEVVLAKAETAGPFVVQAGVFTREANARLYREQLLRRGVSSSVIENAGGRRTVWHVVLGRYESWRAAERARKQFSADLHLELISARLPLRSVAQQVAAI